MAAPTGARLWRFAYRFDGKQKPLALGVYPTVPLARRPAAREDAKRILADGLDPALEKKRQAQARADAPKFGALLRAIDAFDGQPSTRIALQLLALLFPRPGELRLAEWTEFDLERAAWSIPASRMKMRRPHQMPLSRQAVALLGALRSISRGNFLFAGVRSPSRPISDGTLNAALRRLGYAKDEATSHGFRATASSLLNESGKWHPDAIERQLAHIEGNSVRAAYARGEHWDERVSMMQWWAGYLDELKIPASHTVVARVVK